MTESHCKLRRVVQNNNKIKIHQPKRNMTTKLLMKYENINKKKLLSVTRLCTRAKYLMKSY